MEGDDRGRRNLEPDFGTTPEDGRNRGLAGPLASLRLTSGDIGTGFTTGNALVVISVPCSPSEYDSVAYLRSRKWFARFLPSPLSVRRAPLNFISL